MKSNRETTAVIFVQSPKVETYEQALSSLKSYGINYFIFIFHYDFVGDMIAITQLVPVTNYEAIKLNSINCIPTELDKLSKKVKIFDVSGASKVWYGSILVNIISRNSSPIHALARNDKGESIYIDLTHDNSVRAITKKFDSFKFQKKALPIVILLSIITIWMIYSDLLPNDFLKNLISLTTVVANLATIIIPIYRK